MGHLGSSSGAVSALSSELTTHKSCFIATAAAVLRVLSKLKKKEWPRKNGGLSGISG